MTHQPDAPKWQEALRLANAARRCRARRKRDGEPCRGLAVGGRPVCRLHGGKGGAPKGKRNGAFRHGRYSAEVIAERREARATIKRVRALTRLAAALNGGQ